MMPVGLLIGCGAGAVSALLFASASTGTLLGLLVLFFLSPLPVAITGLGWGWPAAAAAALTGAVLVAAAIAMRAAAFHLLALGLPTVILSYLALLNREVAPGNGAGAAVEWYPIGRIVTVAALWAGGLAALGLYATAPDMDALRATLRSTFERIFSISPPGSMPGGETIGEQEIAAFTELMVVTFAGAIATLWMTIATLNLWLAAIVIRHSGRLVRPWPAFSEVRLPRSLPLAFAAAIALTFLPGYPGLIASGFASAFLFAYMLVGLAIVHHLTRDMNLRGLLLGALYACLLFLYPFSWLAVAALGLAEPISPLRRKLPPE
jgi:hypothetical protein